MVEEKSDWTDKTSSNPKVNSDISPAVWSHYDPRGFLQDILCLQHLCSVLLSVWLNSLQHGFWIMIFMAPSNVLDTSSMEKLRGLCEEGERVAANAFLRSVETEWKIHTSTRQFWCKSPRFAHVKCLKERTFLKHHVLYCLTTPSSYGGSHSHSLAGVANHLWNGIYTFNMGPLATDSRRRLSRRGQGFVRCCYPGNTHAHTLPEHGWSWGHYSPNQHPGPWHTSHNTDTSPLFDKNGSKLFLSSDYILPFHKLCFGGLETKVILMEDIC